MLSVCIFISTENQSLFSDAEAGEDGGEEGLVGDGAGEAGEVGDGVAEVLGGEDGGEAGLDGLEDLEGGGFGGGEGLFVSEVGDGDVALYFGQATAMGCQ